MIFSYITFITKFNYTFIKTHTVNTKILDK